MSDTPRTDAFILGSVIKTDWNWRHACRQLERELNAAKAENSEMKKAIQSAHESLDGLDLHLPRNYSMFLLLALEKLQPFLK